MRKVIKALFILLLVAADVYFADAQQPQFSVQIDEKVHHFGPAYGLTQDQQGYMWFGSFTKGLIRYNGKDFKYFRHAPENANSPGSNIIVSMAVDSSGMIWLALFGAGVDRYNPATNTFTHFNFSQTDTNTISSDTVLSVTAVRNGGLFIGSYGGVDTFNTATGKFNRFRREINGKPVKNEFKTFKVYEDKNGEIWSTAGDLFEGKPSDSGGLFRYNPSTRKHTFYTADPKNPESLINPNVFAFFEDSRGNFWIGSKGNGLHTLDRNTGKFTRYLYDSLHREKLSRPPVSLKDSSDFISFINEDHAGKLWIGSVDNGINWYDPATKQLYHYGSLREKKIQSDFNKDTLTGYKETGSFRFFLSKDSLTWITGMSGNIYLVSYGRKTIPYYPNKEAPNSFYLEPNDSILWFGTAAGLVRKDLKTNVQKTWKQDPKNNNSISHNEIVTIQPDEKGRLYVGSHKGGMDLFDPETGSFTHFRYDSTLGGSKPIDSIHNIFIENDQWLWMAGEMGLSRLHRPSGKFMTWRHNQTDSNGIIGQTVYSITKDAKNNLWFANEGGVDTYVESDSTFKHYLKGYSARAVIKDASGKLWAGTDGGLFYFDEARDHFVSLGSSILGTEMDQILSLLEDNDHNIWISTSNTILKLSADREHVQRFNADYGVLSSNWNWLNNYKAHDGRLFIGGSKGYYMFNPAEINVSSSAPLLAFSQLTIGGTAIFPEKNGILTEPIWNADQIRLAYNQNSFSIDFGAVNYNSNEAIKYLYRLENYDEAWRDLGTDHKASFFAVPPGNYKLRIKAVNGEGTSTEKTIDILITPPWWRTWWAYMMYALLAMLAGWQIYLYQKRFILSRERERNREKELEHAKEIEKAYTKLKSTQAQLIQSEKMASLGQLTSGIAHEIQNPLNFVNNFSEVSAELVTEAEGRRLEAGENSPVVSELLNDIKQNLEKISHHGKRADGIVKSMMLHSRPGTEIKESVDINALCDKYLRLVYHGLRGKDNTLQVDLKTNYDPSIGEVELIQDDISRVLLNIIGNAFYAVHEKSKRLSAENKEDGVAYEPAVTLTTKKTANQILISVEDNGIGIPENIMDRIFQPFFTTRPTGQGTGLGLSISYDIIKAHGGEIKVKSTEGAGAEFTIILNSNP
ncbi:two-component regulator propeller domain-containing protein [Pollutibacter soli]|uniref:two-component regulator propeller domain-containing protein n=1 Tax=Pollutibacter soli TaxID=3034157 RepID=UPI003013D92F